MRGTHDHALFTWNYMFCLSSCNIEAGHPYPPLRVDRFWRPTTSQHCNHQERQTNARWFRLVWKRRDRQISFKFERFVFYLLAWRSRAEWRHAYGTRYFYAPGNAATGSCDGLVKVILPSVHYIILYICIWLANLLVFIITRFACALQIAKRFAWLSVTLPIKGTSYTSSQTQPTSVNS